MISIAEMPDGRFAVRLDGDILQTCSMADAVGFLAWAMRWRRDFARSSMNGGES